jgi:hypothetical protein
VKLPQQVFLPTLTIQILLHDYLGRAAVVGFVDRSMASLSNRFPERKVNAIDYANFTQQKYPDLSLIVVIKIDASSGSEIVFKPYTVESLAVNFHRDVFDEKVVNIAFSTGKVVLVGPTEGKF